MKITVDADIFNLDDDCMAMDAEHARDEPTDVVTAAVPQHPDQPPPGRVERESSFEVSPKITLAVATCMTTRDAAVLAAVLRIARDDIFRNNFQHLEHLEVAAMIESGEYIILCKTPKGEDKTKWHAQRVTRAQFDDAEPQHYDVALHTSHTVVLPRFVQ
jgi:hypothetical protein|eukprot:COSAG01_NODE_1896_length_8969_cov_35.725028_6_plen_160_part_00